MAGPTISRTWVHDGPRPGVPGSCHTASVLMNDEAVATADGDDRLAAAHNLREVLRARGIPVEGNVVATEMFERLFQRRRSTRP